MDDTAMKESSVRSAAVVFADRFYMSGQSLAGIRDLGGFAHADAQGAADLAQKIGGSEAVRIIVSEYVPVNDTVLSRAPALRGVIAYGAGYDHMDVEALGRRGVVVCNCRGQNAVSVAELTFALMLSLMRGVCRADPWIRAGLWAEAGRSLPEWATGHELWGKTLGVIGLGQIGARVARIAKGFEMPVLGYDPFMDPSQYERLGVVPAGLAGLLAGSHVVSLHVPLTPDTANMLNSGSLKAARPGMFLVNTSRGRVIEEEALVEALRDGRLAGAALDVFSTEPLGPEHPLVRMDNVILSPHIGALSREAGDRLSDSVFRQARDILEGRSPEGLIG